ncbi:Methionine--tRNA ligase [Trichinella spiralis]|uniref:Methionine--tRNA ligase n=1 Tax=Trichinella spiralis TaxID=6334 RepID=A0ABR3KY43_TRISP
MALGGQRPKWLSAKSPISHTVFCGIGDNWYGKRCKKLKRCSRFVGKSVNYIFMLSVPALLKFRMTLPKRNEEEIITCRVDKNE